MKRMSKRVWYPLVLTVFVSALGIACKPPETNASVRVVPGAAERSFLLESKAKERARMLVGPARAHVLERGKELGGPNAIGKPGDLVLENDQIVVVIDAVGPNAGGIGFAESGGNIVDAADAKVRKDELGQMFTYFGSFPRQAVYSDLKSGEGPEGSAWVLVSGHDLIETSVYVQTRYTLASTDRAVVIETTLENKGNAPVTFVSLGDAIQLGGVEKNIPGKPSHHRGKFEAAYFGGVGSLSSFATTSLDGQVSGITGGSWADTEILKNVTIAKGEKISYKRLFVIGERADTSSLVSELAVMSGVRLGEVQLSVAMAPAGARPFVPRLGTTFELERVEGNQTAGKLSLSVGAGPLRAWLPAGRYRIRVGKGYGLALGKNEKNDRIFEVIEGGVTEVPLHVVPPAIVTARCVDESNHLLPCKVSVEGIEGTKSPTFGPAHTAGLTMNQMFAEAGEGEIPLEKGAYKLSFSRGPEYDLETAIVRTTGGTKQTVERMLNRVIDTRGYLATDFHQHTTLGADAATSARDRIVSNVVEGVEIAVASEHNHVADLQPMVRAMKLDAYLVEVPGNELTSDASKEPWGHANVFPLKAEPSLPKGGAPKVREVPFPDLRREIRRMDPSPILQINHPRSGITGYFSQLQFDASLGKGTHPHYSSDFDALEVWNGRDEDNRERVWQDYISMLQHGFVVTPTADTDTHGVVGQEAGYPRTYVKVSNDTDLQHWDETRNRDLVRGVRSLRNVLLTNGPFLSATLAGAPVGGIVRTSKKKELLNLHLEVPNWITVNTLRLLRVTKDKIDSRDVPISLPPPRQGEEPGKTSPRARIFDQAFPVVTDEDCVYLVQASGTEPMVPVIAEKPLAMTGAIFVDHGGNGAFFLPR